MFLYLVVCEFKNLQTIRKSSLCGFSLGKIINHFLIRISLLNIRVIEVNNSIAIREHFPLHPIIKNDFLLSVFIYSLNFTIIANYLLNDLHVWWILVVVVHWELHVEVFFIFCLLLLLLWVFDHRLLSLLLLLLLLLLILSLLLLNLWLVLLSILELWLLLLLLSLIWLYLELLLILICSLLSFIGWIISFINIIFFFFKMFFILTVFFFISINVILILLIRRSLIHDLILIFKNALRLLLLLRSRLYYTWTESVPWILCLTDVVLC